MIRTTLILVMLLPLTVAAGNHDAPIFTGCPPSLQGGHCDSIFFQVSAINPNSNGANRNIRYHLVSGPGEINKKTGLWIFHPELLDTFQPWPYVVEIAASRGNDTTTSETNCRFEVHIINQFPIWSLDEGSHITVLPGDTMEIPISALELDDCDDLTISIERVRPRLNGSIEYDPVEGILMFAPSPEDADTSFEVTLVANDGHNSSAWQVFFVTYRPDPISVKLSRVKGAEVGDTVAVDLMVTESPIGLTRFELLLDYDEARLRFLRAEEGEPFFSDVDGCNWDRLLVRTVLGCEGSDAGQLLLISARADNYRLPQSTCYLPDSLPARLATLTFIVEGETPSRRETSQLNFYWCRCRDNVAMDETGRVSILTRAVFNYRGRRFKPQPVPGYAGTSLDCLLESSIGNERCQQLELYNGVIEILPDTTEAPIAVRIEKQYGDGMGVPQGQETTVDILLDRGTREVGGFDFLVQYSQEGLSLMDVKPGAFLEECEWEYFEWRYGHDGGCPAGCPSGTVRIVAMADLGGRPGEPSCYSPTSFGTSLATMRFLASNDRTLAGSYHPIYFLWTGCGDNAFSSLDGRELLVSRNVFNPIGLPIPRDTIFPSVGGAIGSCDTIGRGELTRAIDFYGGVVQLQAEDSTWKVGDINLNGRPFEIADAVMFTNYFLLGPDLFGHRLEEVKAVADINGDGVPLMLDDLELFIMIVVGEAEPYGYDVPPVEVDICPVYARTNELYFRADSSNYKIQAIVEGEAQNLTSPWPGTLDYKFDGTVTRVLLDGSHNPTDGRPILTWFGTGQIVEIQGVTDSARALSFTINCPTEAPIAVRIQKQYGNGGGVFQGQTTTVDILLDRSAYELGGFYFMLQYPVTALSAVNVTPGTFYEECGWEYFEFRIGDGTQCPGGCPPGVVLVVAMADTQAPIGQPSCFLPGSFPASLATIEFLVSNDRTLAGTFQPVNFFWTDCYINSLSNKAGTELFVSSNVFDSDGKPVRPDSAFPTLGGAVAYCDTLGRVAPSRAIDFYGGGVKIYSDYVDITGDINQNDLSYEIADVIMFTEYFVSGLEAFGSHPEWSIAASDVNRDGVPLTVEDWVWLVRIYLGNADPYPRYTPVEVDYCAVYARTSELYIRTDSCVGAIQVVVDGRAEHITVPDGVTVLHHYDDSVTRIFMHWDWTDPNLVPCLPTDGRPVFSYFGTGQIKEIYGSTYSGRPLSFTINCPTDADNSSDNLPVSYDLSQNFPNPFNPTTTIEFALPQASDVELIVYNIVGREVVKLASSQMSAGYHTIQWDGRDNSGQSVASGIYLYKLLAGDFVQTKKMMLLK